MKKELSFLGLTCWFEASNYFSSILMSVTEISVVKPDGSSAGEASNLLEK